jgi:hypothetical protein
MQSQNTLIVQSAISHKDFTAGMLSGIAAIFCGHPLDLLKVKIQAKPKQNPNIGSALFRILKNEGVT